jgi:ATP-dependent 26S proteasome regulatory subunit
MSELIDLFHLVKSRVPLITIETRDEKQVLSLILNLGTTIKKPVYGWNLVRGFSLLDKNGNIVGSNQLEPTEVLYTIYQNYKSAVFVLIDYHPYLQNDRNLRLIKELALNSERLDLTIFFVSTQIELPEEVKHLSAKFELAFPTDAEIKSYMMQMIDKWQKENPAKKVTVDESVLNVFIKNLHGLSFSEIKRILYNALRDNAINREDIPEITKAKYSLLNKDNVLYFEHDASSFSDVGGLQNLKEWLEKRKKIFIGDMQGKGIDVPKGILLLGVQGSGKSLAAKAVAGTWGIPLLRLDFGTLYNKYYGETERKTREALKMADMMAPCVLWIDEIEKGLASESNDSGTSKRVLGTLLTWMSERKTLVFLVATANDIQNLPPELMRKGRMDEIFFVDLPDEEIRKEIFTIHLKKRDLNPADFDLNQIAQVCDGFSGSEIEQAIVSGFYSVIGGYKQLNTEILLQEIKRTRPLSVVMAENIDAMREWAKDRTVPAN